MPEDDPRPIWDHIGELRSRILAALAVTGVFSVAALVFTQEIFVLLSWPLEVAHQRTGVELHRIAISPVEIYIVAFKASIGVGLSVAFPVILYEAFRFIHPGLRGGERRAVYPFFALGAVLFYAGAALGYRYGMPWMFSMLLTTQRDFGIEAYWTIDSLFSTEVWMLAACGLAFEIPLVMSVLGRLGVLTPDFFRGKGRATLFLSAVFAAWITPTGDPFTMLATTALILGFLGIGWLCLWVSAKK